MQQQVDEIQGLFNDLTEVAKVMENRDYLLQLRTIQVSQRSIMRRYAELLMQFLNADKYKAILVEIGQQLQRLNTLDLFDPNECFMKWREFVQKPHLVSFLFTFLSTVSPIECTQTGEISGKKNQKNGKKKQKTKKPSHRNA